MKAADGLKAALHYLAKGWHPVPLPRNRKTPPPEGCTGPHPDLTDEQVKATTWTGNIAARLPAGIVGIDLDAYAGPARQTLRTRVGNGLAEVLDKALNGAWISSGRGVTGLPSGIYVFRLPPGFKDARLEDPPDYVDFIQRHHRYIVCSPSRVKDEDADRIYRWHPPGAAARRLPPDIGELTELPEELVRVLIQPAEADTQQSGRPFDPKPPQDYDPKTQYHEWLLQYTFRQVNEGANEEQVIAAAKTTEAYKEAQLSRGRNYDKDLTRMVKNAIRKKQADHPDYQAEQSGDKPKTYAPLAIANTIRERMLLVADNAGRTWRYRNGYYTLDGTEAHVRRAIAAELETRRQVYRQDKANEVLKILGSYWPETINDLTRPDRIVLNNGTLDLTDPAEPTLEDWSPEDYATGQLPCDYLPEAKAPQFVTFLKQSWNGLPQQTQDEYLNLTCQYLAALICDRPPPKGAIVLVSDHPNSGKSTLCYIAANLVGLDNITAVSPHDLEETRFAAADLYGKKGNIVSDLSSATLKNPARLKQLTGGTDIIQGDIKYRQPINFVNTAATLFATNRLPQSYDKSGGYHVRIIPVRFPNRVTKPDTELPHRIIANELPGILNLALQGLQTLTRDGWNYTIPEAAAEDQTAAYTADNPATTWANERTTHEEDAFLLQTEAANDYIDWRLDTGLTDKETLEVKDRRWLYKTLDAAWTPRIRRAKGHGWRNRRLVS